MAVDGSYSQGYSSHSMNPNLVNTTEECVTTTSDPCSSSVRQQTACEDGNEPGFVYIRVSIEELAANGAPLTCEHCNRKFDNLNALHMHLVKTHSIVRSDADFRLFHRTPKLHRIKECRYSDGVRYFNAYKLLHQHYNKVHMKKSLRCEKCNMAFSLRRDLTYHEKRRCAARDEAIAKTIPKNGEGNCAPPSPKRHGNNCRMNESNASSPKLSPAVVMQPVIVLNVHRNVLVRRNSSICRLINGVDACTQTEDALADVSVNEYGFCPNGVDARETCAPNSCNVSAQTSLPPIDSIAFNTLPIYEQNDFHCQTSPLGGVEFGTQMYAGDEMCYREYGQFDESRKDEDGVSTCMPYCVNCASATVPMQSSSNLQANPQCIEGCPHVRCTSSTIEEREFRHAETHVDELDFDEFLRHIETQTSDPFASDALTQTANDFIDSSCMTDWDSL